ncbi:hypothetical protein F0A17_01785 [Billgrantia pellis]|uniref:SLATT domain-containing protein n=1 Tax=Billgrantia pellis TaxID=2606936 RepID=A0A7V7KI43_9GAMM|nr:hypothetical protein [Halomonas pellis]KAA0014405.1 hypothetical protein F0A17_01785 [Halomonas pellis]
MTGSTTETGSAAPKSLKAGPLPQGPDLENAEAEALADEVFAFRHYLLRNVRYHTRRASLFSQWHKATAFVGVFLGSSAALSFLLADSSTLASGMAAVVAFFSAVDLVVGTAAKEAQHMELRRRWVALQRRLESEGLSPEVYLERRTIELDEPAELSIVEMQARNDATLAMLGNEGRDQLLVIPWHQRILGQFINLDTSHIREQGENDPAIA